MNNSKFDPAALQKQPGESDNAYINRLCANKKLYELTWQSLADLANSMLNLAYSESWYRKGYDAGLFGVPGFVSKEELFTSGYVSINPTVTEIESVTTSASTVENEDCDGNCADCENQIDCLDAYMTEIKAKEAELNETLATIRKERIKLSDERSQERAYVRRLAREETLQEIAEHYAETMNKNLRLPIPAYTYKQYEDEPREGILLLSDWHYGFDFKNPKNEFNSDICKNRVLKLVTETCNKIDRFGISKLHVLNLSDLIAGRIHLTIRLASREDTITQIMEVSEILAEALNQLSIHCPIEYHQVNDNHSRIEPNKNDSLELETLCRITPWFLKNRLISNSNIKIYDTEYSPDIAIFNVLGHKIAAVHGDKDKPTNIVTNLSRLTNDYFELICAAHNHHFSSTEENDTMVIFNGSLMGTDDYAFSLRLHSTPSQTLIIVTPENITDDICRIPLEKPIKSCIY